LTKLHENKKEKAASRKNNAHKDFHDIGNELSRSLIIINI